MPLYIDDVQVNPRHLVVDMLKLDPKLYERIIKKPTFELDSSRVLKKSTIKDGKQWAKKPTYGVLTQFWFQHEGLMKRLRYAESQNRKIEGGAVTYIYEPKRLDMEGGTVTLFNQPERAVFMYLNPGNPTSPFHDKTKKKFAYMDSVERTKMQAGHISNIQKALNHAIDSKEEELVLVAKGMKVLLNDDYDIEELRVTMQNLAINPVTNKQYVRAMEDDMIRIEGRIRNMVDKGAFKLNQRGSGRQWVWAKTAREGEFIGEPILNVHDDALQRLINYIKGNLENYLYDLRNYTDELQSDRKARQVLQAEKEKEAEPVEAPPAHLTQVNAAPNTGETPLKEQITTYKEAMAYVGERGYPRTPAIVKEFNDAIQEGRITNDNVKAIMREMFQ